MPPVASRTVRSVSGPVSAALPWRADQGDGHYRNPVLFADYSDPDAIRVGDDYWMTSSSFCHVPGLPILHSRDLVNWSLVNHALPQLVPVKHFSVPRHGGGVWAPAIRYHASRFWIYYPDPDFGIYVVTARDPRGVWSSPVLVKGGRGLIDPCPFWDQDGTGYLIHGWAKSRAGINNRLTLHRLRGDNSGLSDSGEVVVDGGGLTGWHTIEGPKLYRRGNFYYIFCPAGGVADGFQAVFRSRRLLGPYEPRVVLARGTTAVNGPHQGAWVDTPAGGDWFLHFQELPAYGRVVHLQPMCWENDWPVIGRPAGVNQPGEPVPGGRLPKASGAAPRAPAASDEFSAPELGLQWQWQANPHPDWFLLQAPPGGLRLRCVRESPEATLWSAGHLLLQKFPAPEFEVTTLLELRPTAEGEIAGLVVFGSAYAWLGLHCDRGHCKIVLHRCDDSHRDGCEQAVAECTVDRRRVFLRVTVHAGAQCQFAFSVGGVAFIPMGDAFSARSGKWVGAKVGIFASARTPRTTATGYADFDWFRVTPLPA